MISYVSTRGGIAPIRFDQAILEGFASDQGLFVPETLPQLSRKRLEELASLSYPELALEILTLFIDPDLIPKSDLEELISRSLAGFTSPEILPLRPLQKTPDTWIMELFHGPTLSFKDLSMGFLIQTMDYLLKKRKTHLNLVLATTGDTGPAAAYATAGTETIDCWPLYPAGTISREQEGQMTSLQAANVHPVKVTGCPDGVNDLDLVLTDLFGDAVLKKKLQISSVNSINWCRVMFQSIHYFYGYFKICNNVGDPVTYSVPSGAFGNLFGGYLARAMGLPISGFVCSVNANRALETVFSTGLLKQSELCHTLSPAIDIVVPYNFWRFLYFIEGQNPEKIRTWMDCFQTTGELQLPPEILEKISERFTATAVSDETTLTTIQQTYERENYLLDPHGAVALAGAKAQTAVFGQAHKTICLATAHPAKFPDIITQAIGHPLPEQAFHSSLIKPSEPLTEGKSCPLHELQFWLTAHLENRSNHG